MSLYNPVVEENLQMGVSADVKMGLPQLGWKKNNETFYITKI